MKRLTSILLAVLLVAIMATSTQVSAAEQPRLQVLGSYTIQNDCVYYEIRMTGDPVCYLGFTIQSDLDILDIKTNNTAFREVMYEGPKVLAYSFGNVKAENALVVTVVLEAPAPGQSGAFNLTELEVYNFSEQPLEVTSACPAIEVLQEAPPAPEPSTPAPTEPSSSAPLPTNPTPTETKPTPTETKPTPTETKPTPTTQPQQSETEATVSSPSTETHPIDTEEKSEAPWFDKFTRMNIYTFLGFCFLVAGLVVAAVILVLKFL